MTFEGAAFEEQYMLGDAEVDWSRPRGYGIRAMHQTDGSYSTAGTSVFVIRPDGYLGYAAHGAHLRTTFA